MLAWLCRTTGVEAEELLRTTVVVSQVPYAERKEWWRYFVRG
jgi:hypothetical protein